MVRLRLLRSEQATGRSRTSRTPARSLSEDGVSPAFTGASLWVETPGVQKTHEGLLSAVTSKVPQGLRVITMGDFMVIAESNFLDPH